MLEKFKNLFEKNLKTQSDVYIIEDKSLKENQSQTNNIFSDKWSSLNDEGLEKQNRAFDFQKKWYLNLYGFANEKELQKFLANQSIIVDAGCGLGYKSKWFSDLSPSSIVIGIDFSDSVFFAQKKYQNKENLFFVKGDIANTKIKNESIDFVSCDQVIHHTENPLSTMKELSRILKFNSEIAVYVYAKKAIPRELLDEYFRKRTKSVSNDEMWEFSEQLTELGKRLTDLNIEFETPSIPLLGIKGGKIDIQRFIYWNFIKCFWNEKLGKSISINTNYDWYAPSNAERYSKEEFLRMINICNFTAEYFHSEDACYSGRFAKTL